MLPKSGDDGACTGLWRFKGRLGAAMLALALYANWGWQTVHDRSLELSQAADMVTALARASEYQIDGSIRSISALLDEAADRIDLAHWPDARLSDWFSARLGGYPEIRNLVLVDAEGHIRATITRSDDIKTAAGGTLADRPHFQAAKAEYVTRPLYIGAPVTSRLTGLPSIPIDRVKVDAKGRFAGLVVAEVDPEFFRRKLAVVMVEPPGSAGLFLIDGAVVLAREPKHAEMLGRTVSNSPLFSDYVPRSPNGVAELIAVVDGNDKLLAYRTLGKYPLLVTVGITRATALAHWKRQAIQEVAVLTLVVLGLIALAWLYDLRAAASRRLAVQLQEQKNLLEVQVAERTAHLESTNAELEQFAYIASHDLQEPLRTITGFLQLLSRRYTGQLDSEADEFIAFAVNGAKRMSLLINDLLAFSRVGRSEEEPEMCDTTALARGALDGLAQAVVESGASVEIADMPQVLCRPIQVQSLFQNLIGNAVKYRAAERNPVVKVWAEPAQAGMVRFAVADNGIGIAEEYHQRVFGIFQRLHHRDKYEGTGIGLALCRKIVERHGGRIWLESEPGKGTTMWFTLPKA